MKVGHCQAFFIKKPRPLNGSGFFFDKISDVDCLAIVVSV